MVDPSPSRVQVEAGGRESGPIAPMREPDPCSLVIFGATGDLSYRKLLPALYELSRDDLLPQPFHILGYARRPYSDEDFSGEARENVEEEEGDTFDPKAWERLVAATRYVQGEFQDPSGYRNLKDALEEIEAKGGTRGNRLFYLATPPAAFSQILERLKEAELFHPHRPDEGPWSRVVVEKPFGHDLESAQALNARIATCLDEEQVYRIDHYLGKETVQNILVFRFGNAIFEPVWNRKYVDHVQITAAETVGVEGRAGYYDGEGVVRDMVQNHLLQLLTLCAMEPPGSFRADDIRDEKVKVLRALRRMTAAEVDDNVVHGQYLGYQRVEGVDEESRTPTYAALRLFVDNWRWQGVPFYLRTGKKLRHRRTEVSIHFQSIPLCLFQSSDLCTPVQPNVLTMRIQPDEGIQLSFTTKVPGEDLTVGDVEMDFRYAQAFGAELPAAYERLLLDCMRGDATLFARSDEVEEAWDLVDPILHGYEKDEGASLALYSPGTDGPREGDDLPGSDGRRWEDL